MAFAGIFASAIFGFCDFNPKILKNDLIEKAKTMITDQMKDIMDGNCNKPQVRAKVSLEQLILQTVSIVCVFKIS